MHSSHIFLSVLSMLGTQVLRAVSQTPECSSLHIFLVRGTTEEYPGVQQHIAEAICSGLDDCAYSSIQYPAVFEDYCHSVEVGINSTHAALEDYVARCPDASIVLSGFSQGGQVVGDALAGGGDAGETQNCENGQTVTEALNPDEAPGNKVIAALLWGSTRHTANQTYNVLDGASKDGLMPRSGDNLEALNLWSNRLQDYCVQDDPACAQGTQWEAHVAYFEVYQAEAAEFVHSKLSS